MTLRSAGGAEHLTECVLSHPGNKSTLVPRDVTTAVAKFERTSLSFPEAAHFPRWCRHMMYTITRGPSKLVTQRRTTGPTQQIDSKLAESKHKPTTWLTSNAPTPKIVFNRLNGKRYHGASTQKVDSPAEGFTPAHEENVKFVYEAWREVQQELGDEDVKDSTGSQGPVQYTEKIPNTAIKNFVPMDLEEWWAQRFLANIAGLS
ncbi:MAPK regulated corepressor interacting protein 2-like [Entelurus aequoreus]|uniref:MAPK regulated corepressor interacting protein 2-like n=1 Tax=Entelurus aequoreus TaxID=161455 RepID=UPI002B1DA81C|nr:MAPK regulated corepressor interacting protein 2-like [Entelurus aequoreus]